MSVFYGTRPKGIPREPDPPFYFDYDFDKYQLNSIGNIFPVLPSLESWRPLHSLDKEVGR